MDGDTSMPVSTVDKIKDENNICVVCIASIWEIAIKYTIGKLETKVTFNEIADFLYKNNLRLLPIEFRHLQILLNLEMIHRDPFDRVIIAQVMTKDLTILSIDKHFPKYPVKCAWY
jgi:PIN domain nuclease of toxin-antitoxin system